MSFTTKDSGVREEFDSGMKRDTQAGKPRFDLIVPKDLPYEQTMLTRWAQLLERGAVKYGDRNWEKANSEAELERAKASAFRHFMQWYHGKDDEDHAAAVIFNIQEAEYVKFIQATTPDVKVYITPLNTPPPNHMVEDATKYPKRHRMGESE